MAPRRKSSRIVAYGVLLLIAFVAGLVFGSYRTSSVVAAKRARKFSPLTTDPVALQHVADQSVGSKKKSVVAEPPMQREEQATPAPHEEEHHHESWDPSRPLVWKRRDLYLPINDDAKGGFMANNDKQATRISQNADLKRMWNSFDISRCIEEVPECEFFKNISAKTVYKKCCVEHMKMKASLFYTLDVAEAKGIKLFLDSGTLLSAMRDGGDTLVPWETDIDLGVVGVVPSTVSTPFKEYSEMPEFKKRKRRHLFSECLTKVSKNVSRHGMCRDAHYIYYAQNEDEARVDTSRVEIWPFWPEGDSLIHPTRKKLTVNRALVEPLVFGGRCKMWGRPCYCPADSEGYLDHEYTRDWRYPKTIHWGKNNIKAWRPIPPEHTGPPKTKPAKG